MINLKVLIISAIVLIASADIKNPVIWQDFADLDIIRVNTTYYYSASTMHYSPGAPILRSYDLVNWEYAGHSVPHLDFGTSFDLTNGHAYVNGIWASFFNYRKSNNMFYWGGCIHGEGQTHIYTSSSVEGSWTRLTTINKCYYDCGLLIDDDDTMYVVYASNGGFTVAQLSKDGKTEVKSQEVYKSPSNIGYLEGARFYKRDKEYYIFTTHPANGQYILKSDHPYGTYTIHQVLLNLKAPTSGAGVPHQGGLVDTPDGKWYYMAFEDAYPGGRVPVLAPITWGSDGFPTLTTVSGAWGQTYPAPLPTHAVASMIGADTFAGSKLGPRWEWNHNPDTTKFSVNNGLHLQTATVTQDIYAARNTLTHRIEGPTSTATVVIDVSGMKDGDHTGLAIFRDHSAYIGVKQDAGAHKVIMVNALDMDGNWKTTSTGKEEASQDITVTKIYLRAQANIEPGTGRQAHFSYSTDGSSYHSMGSAYTLLTDWHFFLGYRFAVFNFATKALGGSVTVEKFEITAP